MSAQGDAELASVFGVDASRIPEDLRPVLLQRWSTLRHELDSSRPSSSPSSDPKEPGQVDAIAKCRELEAAVANLEAQLAAKTEENENNARQLEDMHTSYSQTRHKVVSLEESNDSLKTETNELKRDRDRLQGEVTDLGDVSNRRQEEVNRLHNEWQTLSVQLNEANAAKCQALVRCEDVEGKEIALRHREKRIDEERELFQQQLATLSEDLRNAHEECACVRRESAAKIAHLQSDLDSKTENLRILEAREEALMSDKEVLQERLDDLIDRLKEARESKSTLEEGFRQEVRAQTKLADLYQSQSKDSEEKANELTRAVTELQALLREASDRYGALEDNFDKEKVEHKEEIRRRNDAIRALRKELDNANELIKSLKQKGLTEEGIQQLSPAAAAASKLIKSGMSLTQVYSQLVACQEELLAAQDENRRLNSYLEQILTDIEERAPALKRQRDEYERAISTVNNLNQQLEDAREMNMNDKEEAEAAQRRLAGAQRESERLQKQVKDLGHQVTVLLREVEAARAGTPLMRQDTSAQVLDADGVISDRLVTFRDVSELQQKNAEMLAVIREMSANQEKAESQLVEEKTAHLKRELESVQEQLEELREARRRQETLVENIIVQRDMYKSMADNSQDKHQEVHIQQQQQPIATSTPGGPLKMSPGSPSFHQLELKASKAEAALAEIKKEFDVYRTEKCVHEKMLTEQLDKTREELNESRGKAIKLASQEEWNTERFKISQANAASYRKEISFLAEKNQTLHSVVAKHEQAVQSLHEELLSTQSSLARTQNQLERAKHDVSVLKSTEARLEKEREILHRQKSGSALIAENLKMVQLQLERTDSEAKMRLQNQNESLTKEVALLRKKVEAEQESYHSSVKAYEASQATLREQVDKLKDQDLEAKQKIETLTASMEEMSKQLQISQEKLKLSGNTSTNLPDLTSEKVLDLTSQVTTLKNEVVTLKEHLSKARQATNQYKELADAAEKQVIECNNASRKVQANYDQLVKASQAEKDELRRQIQVLETEKSDLVTQSHGNIGTQANVDNLNVELRHLNDQLEAGKRRETEMEAELAKQLSRTAEMQQRYERELMQHGQTAQNLSDIRDTVNQHANKLAELEEAKTLAEEALKEAKENFGDTEKSLRDEQIALQQQFEVIDKENAALHEQLSNVSQQMSALHDSMQGGDTSLNKSVDRSFSEEDAKSSEQLMQIVKYLRKEKAILTGKVEVVQAEAIRLRAQLEASQSQLKEGQAAMESLQDRSKLEMLPSAKYSQLLEKVQTIPALGDSNRVLREQRDALEKNLTQTTKALDEANGQIEPLKEKIKVLEEQEEKTLCEMTALKADNIRWRQRVNQLIEKHQKISPEEMKKAQAENARLSKLVSQLQGQSKVGQANINQLTAKLKALEEKVKSKEAEVTKHAQEAQNVKSVNQQVAARLNGANKKVAELEAQVKQLTSDKQEMDSNMDAANKTLTGEVEELKKAIKEKEAVVTSAKLQMNKLKTIGRTFKEKSELFYNELETLKKEHAKVTEELANAKEAAANTSIATSESTTAVNTTDEKLVEAEQLIEQSANQIAELESKVEEVTKAKETVEEETKKLRDTAAKATQKEERAKQVLVTAKNKISNLTTEKGQLQAQVQELKALKGMPGASVASATEAMKKSYEAQLAALNVEKETLSEEAQKEREEKEKLAAELHKMIQDSSTSASVQEKAEKTETVTGMVKPVVTGTPAAQQQQQQRKQPQPHAHIQPTRHMPAQLQTATIRPTAMRSSSSSSPSVVIRGSPTAVQPTIASVSPSSNLNPAAQDFVPRVLDVNPSTSADNSEEQTFPTAKVWPRQTEEQQNLPSTSQQQQKQQQQMLVAATASVAPTPKRRRDEEAASEEAEQAKKARTTTEPAASSTTQEDDDDVVVLDSTSEEEVEDEEEEEVEDEEPNAEETTQEMTGDEELGDDDEVEEEDEVMDEEDDEAAGQQVGEDVEEEDGEEVDEGDDEEQQGNDQEDEVDDEDSQQGAGGRQQGSDDVVVVESDDEDQYGMVDDTSQMQSPGQSDDVGSGGGTTSAAAVVPELGEPSSSSVHDSSMRGASVPESTEAAAAAAANAGEGTSQQHQQQSGQFEDVDDSVVPSTPKLTGRTEASSSPHVPSFLFGSAATGDASVAVSSSSGSGGGASVPQTFAAAAAKAAAAAAAAASGVSGASQEGLDRTAVDIAQYAADQTGPAAQQSTPSFASLAQMASPSSFGGQRMGGAAMSPFGASSAPIFGTTASIGAVSTSGSSSRQPEDESKDEQVESSEGDLEVLDASAAVAQSTTQQGSAIPVLGQPIEVVTSSGGGAQQSGVVTSESMRGGQVGTTSGQPRGGRGPRLSRTPITWNSPPSGASSSTPPGDPTSAAMPPSRGRALANRGSRARRSRPPRGTYGRGTPGPQ